VHLMRASLRFASKKDYWRASHISDSGPNKVRPEMEED
jgi:hypothetical protein